MTVSQLLGTISSEEMTRWIALWTIRAEERKRAEAEANQHRRR